MGRVFRSLVSGGRAGNHGFDPAEVKQEAQSLYDVTFKKKQNCSFINYLWLKMYFICWVKAGEGKLGTDESINILSQ